MKQNKKNHLVIALLIINLVITSTFAGLLIVHMNAGKDNAVSSRAFDYTYSMEGKYTLYIGTNDKDTYQQIIPTEEARDIINKICVKYVEGYTSSEARGGWVDETGALTQENTLVYTFYGVTEQQIASIMDEVIKELNQNSILVEVQDMNYAYYYGSADGSAK